MDVLTPQLEPGVPQLPPEFGYRLLARFDQQFVPRFAGLGGRVMPDVEAEEVKPFPQMNDPGLFP